MSMNFTSGKECNVEQLNDNGGLKKSGETNQLLQSLSHNEYNEKEDKNSQKSIECPKQSSRTEAPLIEEDHETIEKIAEMIAGSSNESNESNNPRTKKQLQILMSRSNTETNFNYTSEHNAVKLHTKVSEINDPNRIIHVNPDADQMPSHQFSNSLEIIQESKTGPSTENVEVKTPDKIRFEEVENKLEEMFAGIEDEQLMHPTNSKSIPQTNSDKIGDDFELENIKLMGITTESSETSKNVNSVETLSGCYENQIHLTNNSPLPTKAAKKSTESFTLKSNKIDALTEATKSTTDIDVKKLKTMPPRRRLSVGIDLAQLRISLASPTETNRKQKKNTIDKDVLSEYRNGNETRRIPKRSKIKKYRKNSPENKREITSSKTLNSNKRKNIKTESYGNAKQKKSKHGRMQNSLSSDNDNGHEERTQQQIREIENKIRSPFILVKQNGAITVVNTATADDFNEKNTKAKKTGTFAHERKTVRGCHSSTLSNRYDAETADSSWICVFCKRGPHKRGLGDLFGPYIVSMDCEEYRSAADVYTEDSTDTFKKSRRVDPLVGSAASCDAVSSSSKTTQTRQTKCPNETVTNQTHLSETQDILDGNEQPPPSFDKFSLGMSRVSDIGFEIWLHEDCAIWAPNLFVIGSRLIGLEAAIWNSTRYKCVLCLKPGAILCCLRRDCKITAHVPCARESHWSLDELSFWAHCKEHVSKTF